MPSSTCLLPTSFAARSAAEAYRESAMQRSDTMATLYISYTHRDRDFVAVIAEHLKSQGHLLTLDVEALCSTLCVQRAREASSCFASIVHALL